MRQPQELLAVLAGVRRDAAQPALLEHLVRVVQRRDLGEPDAGHCQGRAAVERPQRHRDELTGRGEQDRAVEGLGRRGVGLAHRVDAELGRQLPIAGAAGENVHP